MTYINLTDDLCDPGAMLDTLSPDTVKRAGYIDATKPHKRPAGPYIGPLRDLPEIMGRVCANLFSAQVYFETRLKDDAYAQYLAAQCQQTVDEIRAWTKKEWGQS